MNSTNADILAAIASLRATYETGHKALEGKVDDIDSLLREQNGRVRKLEVNEAQSGATIACLPGKVDAIEKELAEMRGAIKLAKWSVGGGVAGVLALLAELLGRVP
jgi:hypothetical protein